MMKSFSSVSTNVYVKATEEKLITVNADYGDLFRRLLNCCCKCSTDQPEGALKLLLTVTSSLFIGTPR